jgi:hypothetical protein
MVQAALDAVASTIPTGVGTFALAVQLPIDALAARIQTIGGMVVAMSISPTGAAVVALLDAVALGIQPILDVIAPAIQAAVDTVAEVSGISGAHDGSQQQYGQAQFAAAIHGVSSDGLGLQEGKRSIAWSVDRAPHGFQRVQVRL